MNDEILLYLEKYSEDIREMFLRLRELVMANGAGKIEEKMWARLPSYYVGEKFVRFIPFKDHINIEARAISEYSGRLSSYKITPKGMLQLYIRQAVPEKLLEEIFFKTLFA